MDKMVKPALWLILLIAGLPILSETVYAPSLPDISRDLKTTEAFAEYTLTVYLFSFAIGTFFWGKISDKLGRKPCMIIGIFIYILGCIGCYFSDSITFLMISRVVQAFGGSVGSVLGQAICRDAFHGPELGKVYSVVGAALPVFPAIGPVIGGYIAEKANWNIIFVFLAVSGFILWTLIMLKLPETHLKEQRSRVSLKSVLAHIFSDRYVLILAFIIGGCQGIVFSYFAEGSFYLINLLGMSPSEYGMSFLAIGSSAALGCVVSKKMHDRSVAGKKIMGYGLGIVSCGSFVFSVFVLSTNLIQIPTLGLIYITILSQMVIMFGGAMATNNAMAMALVDYRWCVGTASSVFGFIYYTIISICTLVMGSLHNGTIFPMPLYFLSISILMILAKNMLKK